MKERPILFNGDMVRATLDGRKTQTRRPVNKQKYPHGTWATPEEVAYEFRRGSGEFLPPLGTVGDRLWVRETFRIYRSFIECACYDDCQCASMNGKPLYRASYPSPDDDKWTPSIHMPRWASRIDLEITRVWVERVQDITEEDARAEGVIPDDYEGCEHPDNPTLSCAAHRYSFRDLWQSIYGTRPSLPKNKRSKRYERVKRWLDRNPAMDWDANPWVWVYEFRRIKP